MSRKKTIVEEFDPARVRPLPDQPRKRFRGIRELAASISEVGQATPGIVTLCDDDKRFDAQLVDGERRLRACKMAGVNFRAEIREARAGEGIEDIFVASFAANFGKQDHDVLEIAEGLARMQRAGKTLKQMAAIAGKSDNWVCQHLNLLKLCPEVREMMIRGEEQGEDEPRLTFQVAQLLAPVAESEQIRLAKKIVERKLSIFAARRLVLRERSRKGDPSVYLHNKGPRTSIQTVGSILGTANERLGVFLDMPAATADEMIELITPAQRRKLVQQIETTREHLARLADSIRQRIPDEMLASMDASAADRQAAIDRRIRAQRAADSCLGIFCRQCGFEPDHTDRRQTCMKCNSRSWDQKTPSRN